MSCTKCNCKTAPCGCEDQGLTTPPPCSVDTAFCPKPSPCSEQFDSQCIVYNGDGNVCADIAAGQNLQAVIDILTAKLEPFLCLQCPSVFIPISGAIDVSLTPTLTWNPVAGATAYDVYLDTVTPPTTLVLGNTTATSYTVVTPLLENTTYYWQIVSQNAGGEALNCSILEFTTLTIPVPACTSPVQYILDLAINASPTQTPIDLLASITSVLTNGVILTECDLCCPDCTSNLDPYVLGNTVNFLDVIAFQGQGWTASCCLNVESSVIAYDTFIKVNPRIKWVDCCNDFNTCVADISDAVATFPDMLIEGILEYGTLDKNTSVCILLETLQAITPALTPAQLQDLISDILTLGIVVQCSDGQILISSIDTYINYNPF